MFSFGSTNRQFANQFAQQQTFFNNINSYAANPGYYSYSYAPTYSAAAASGAVGPGGVYQSATIYPSVSKLDISDKKIRAEKTILYIISLNSNRHRQT